MDAIVVVGAETDFPAKYITDCSLRQVLVKVERVEKKDEIMMVRIAFEPITTSEELFHTIDCRYGVLCIFFEKIPAKLGTVKKA